MRGEGSEVSIQLGEDYARKWPSLEEGNPVGRSFLREANNARFVAERLGKLFALVACELLFRSRLRSSINVLSLVRGVEQPGSSSGS
jgi:hypothetical protein